MFYGPWLMGSSGSVLIARRLSVGGTVLPWFHQLQCALRNTLQVYTCIGRTEGKEEEEEEEEGGGRREREAEEQLCRTDLRSLLVL